MMNRMSPASYFALTGEKLDLKSRPPDIPADSQWLEVAEREFDKLCKHLSGIFNEGSGNRKVNVRRGLKPRGGTGTWSAPVSGQLGRLGRTREPMGSVLTLSVYVEGISYPAYRIPLDCEDESSGVMAYYDLGGARVRFVWTDLDGAEHILIFALGL